MSRQRHQTPESFRELQNRAKILGGSDKLAIRLEAVELIYAEFINLFAQILTDFRQLYNFNLAAAANLLSIDAKILSKLETADKNFACQTYLDAISIYRNL